MSVGAAVRHGSQQPMETFRASTSTEDETADSSSLRSEPGLTLPPHPTQEDAGLLTALPLGSSGPGTKREVLSASFTRAPPFPCHGLATALCPG